MVIATGITASGDREILGVDIGDSEDETFWTRFLRSLKDRGLAGVWLVISDAHAGLKASIRKCFTGSSWQRCRVHFVRNLLATVPRVYTEFVAAAFRSIFALGTANEVAARWDDVETTLAERFPKAAALMRDAKTDVLAFTPFRVSTLALGGVIAVTRSPSLGEHFVGQVSGSILAVMSTEPGFQPRVQAIARLD